MSKKIIFAPEILINSLVMKGLKCIFIRNAFFNLGSKMDYYE